MKGTTHIFTAIPLVCAAFICAGPVAAGLALVGCVAPDFAHAITFVTGGKPPALTSTTLPIYRAGHSLVIWFGLLLSLQMFVPHIMWIGLGVLTHLLLDWPTHTGNRPLWPIELKFDGKGA